MWEIDRLRQWKWLLLGGKGEMELVEAGKDAIMRRIGISDYHLVTLDSVLTYPPISLGCDPFIIIILEYVKAIITVQEVLLLLNSRYPSVTLFVQEFQAMILRHHQGSPSSKHHPDHDPNPNSDAIKILPFEFIAFEGCLEAACSVLKNEAANMLEQVHSVLEKLTSDIDTLTLNLKSITERVGKMRNNFELSDNFLGTRVSSYGAITKQLDVKELDMLFEHYFVQMDGTLKKLLKVKKYVDDREIEVGIKKYINFMLDCKRYRGGVLFVLMSAIGFLIVVVFALNKLKRLAI